MALWHYHPVIVHFSIALLLTGSAFFIAHALFHNRMTSSHCLTAARWTFWSGIIMLLLTAVTGLIAYLTVPNVTDDLRPFVNNHVVAAVITAFLYLSLAFFLWRRREKHLPPGAPWNVILLLAMISVCYTGYLGGNLVYYHGVGVTPAVEAPPQ
jgi:uncharacterized membrane protein